MQTLLIFDTAMKAMLPDCKLLAILQELNILVFLTYHKKQINCFNGPFNIS
jgi:hypothetical protein